MGPPDDGTVEDNTGVVGAGFVEEDKDKDVSMSIGRKHGITAIVIGAAVTAALSGCAPGSGTSSAGCSRRL